MGVFDNYFQLTFNNFSDQINELQFPEIIKDT